MKYVLIFLLAIPTGLCRANDTLTRAQVYNFSIGDTFDYLIIQQDNYPGGPHYSESLFRQIITDVHYSAASDTIFIVKEHYLAGTSVSSLFNSIVPDAVQFFSDTLVITNLDDYEIYYYDYGFSNRSYILNDSLNGRKINGVSFRDLGFWSDDIFGEGLGTVMLSQSGGDGYQGWDMTIELKYYSKGTETWGTLLPVGINTRNTQQELNMTVYPTVNSGTIHISFDLLPIETEFRLIDVYGRTILISDIQSELSSINITDYVPGFYVWTLTGQNKILKTGKLILQ